MSEELFVVTGGGTGRGRDLALRLAEAGGRVLVVGRRAEPLADTAAAAASGTIETLATEVSTVEGAAALVAAVGGRPVTGVVTAAEGQGDFRRGGDGPTDVRDRWTAALEKNFFSALLPIEALAPLVIDRRGRVVLISSTAALDG